MRFVILYMLAVMSWTTFADTDPNLFILNGAKVNFTEDIVFPVNKEMNVKTETIDTDWLFIDGGVWGRCWMQVQAPERSKVVISKGKDFVANWKGDQLELTDGDFPPVTVSCSWISLKSMLNRRDLEPTRYNAGTLTVDDFEAMVSASVTNANVPDIRTVR